MRRADRCGTPGRGGRWRRAETTLTAWSGVLGGVVGLDMICAHVCVTERGFKNTVGL